MSGPNPSKFSSYTPLPDGSGFTLSDGKVYKYDKEGGCNGNPVIKQVSTNRFQEYILLEDKSGFKLKDGSCFYFDKYGGWYDEQKCYYNSNGIKSNPPEEPKSFAEEQKIIKDNALYSIQAQLQKNKEQQQQSKKQTKIAKIQKSYGANTSSNSNNDLNEQCWKFYKENPEKSELLLYFKFENVFVKGSEIIEFLKQGNQEVKIKEFGFDYYDENKKDKKGTGWFICKNKFSTLNCVKCNNAVYYYYLLLFLFQQLKDKIFQISLKPFQVDQKSEMSQKTQKQFKPKINNNHFEQKPAMNSHLIE